MVKRNLFTNDEIVLCTYAARYGSDDFGGTGVISTLTDRSLGSIKMKIQNIASMLDEHDVSRDASITALTGKTTGESGRLTNWDVVSQYIETGRDAHLSECKNILDGSP